jgi:PAS domain S-box-containing protein
LVFESAQVRKDGSVLPVEICSRAIELDGQKAFFSVIRNVSERKRAELKSLASEEKWRLLFENMTTGFALHEVVCDEQGRAVDYRFLEINPAYEQLTGLKASNIIGRTVREVLPGTEAYWIEIFGRVALSGEPTSYENYSKELERWYQVRVFCPKIGQFAVIVSDITERKKFEESLQLYSMVLESSSEGMVVTDADNLIIAVNPAFLMHNRL